MATKESLSESEARLRALYVQRRAIHMNTLRDAGQLGDDECVKLHPKWDGGVDSRGTRHKSCWPKLAAFAEENRLDVGVWVAALFNIAHTFDHVPYPTDLLNKRVLEFTARYPKERAIDIKYGARTELLLVSKEIMFRRQQTKLPEALVVRQVLVDPTVEVSPLTRYVQAVSRKAFDIAQLCEAAAVTQYRTAPEPYREAFGSLLPKRLLELAAAK